jgi:phosphoadenosine phosphosulfate reductase
MTINVSKNSTLDDAVTLIKNELQELKRETSNIFLTSSLQTHSLPLVHIIHSIDSSIPVFFLDTGYHFPETIDFKEKLKADFGFNIQDLSSPIDRINQRDGNGRLMYASDPDYCCHINKVLPLEPVLHKYDVWISGVRADQSSHRSQLAKFEQGKHNTRRYHPILEWNSSMIHRYRKLYDLPAHPLEEQGYFSIGCMPCTRKPDPNASAREARWFGMNKTECGLHTETLEK